QQQQQQQQEQPQLITPTKTQHNKAQQQVQAQAQSSSCIPCLFTAMTDDDPLSLDTATAEAVPRHLRQLLGQLQRSQVNAVELLLLLVYAVALECGYVRDSTYREKRKLLKPVPAVGSFHIYNVRLLSECAVEYSRESDYAPYRMLLRTLLDDASGEDGVSIETTLQSMLTAVVLGDLLLVTLSPVPPSRECGFSVCLSMGRYVLNVQLQPLHQRFRHLDELSLELRQKIFQPMRAQQMLALKLHLYPSLLGLPAELYDEIFRHLTTNQLNIVANVNRKLCFHSTQYKGRPKSNNKH
ncbi:hypothetical protein KR222_008953, partial [Zaprionus bogoriensis]